MIDYNRIPRHIAIIMDGNGRWAKKKHLPRLAGHNAGMKSMKEIVRRASDIGVKYLTVYAFSTENWKRSFEEVSGIFKLFIKYVNSDLKELDENNVKVNFLGDMNSMSEEVLAKIHETTETTKNNTGMNFNIAMNYGSRDEIIHAIKNISNQIVNNEISVEDISEELVDKNLYTGDSHGNIPDPDLMIRTSGEIRLSNFLLWQLAYSEFVFTDVLWPDFSPEVFENCIEEYQNRDRRFGGRNE